MKSIRTKTREQLMAHLLECKKELFNLRFIRSQGSAVPLHRFRIVRKDVARTYTLLNDKTYVPAIQETPTKKPRATKKRTASSGE